MSFRSIFFERRDQHIPWFHLFCLSWSYLFKFLYIQPSFLFLSEHLHYLPPSLSSSSHPQSFPAEHWCMRRRGSTQSPIQSSSTSPPRISQSPTWDGWWGRGSALGVGGYVMCCHWSLLDSRDIKDAWLLQGQDITITLSLSFFFYRCICSFWLFCSCRSARMLLIWYNIRLTQCKTTNTGEFMCL